MPESKRELANKELKETDFVTLSQESQDETPLMLQGLEDENQNYLMADNNYNVNINLSTNKNVSQQEVKNLVNNVVNNEQITSSEDLKKNSSENLNQSVGSEDDPNFVGPPSYLMNDPVEQPEVTDYESDPNFVGPPSYLMNDPVEADEIHPIIDYPYQPFQVSNPMTFTPETFSSLPVSVYATTQKKELPSTTQGAYFEVNRIIEQSLQPVSSGGAVITPYLDELPKEIMGIQYNSEFEIEPSTNNSLDAASEESQKGASIDTLRQEEMSTGIKNISENTSKSSDVELSGIANTTRIPGVQMQPTQSKGIYTYPGDSSIFAFSKEKNSSPSWRTASS